MQRQSPELIENLQSVINRYNKYDFNAIMPFDRLNILKNRINKVNERHKFTGYCKYIMAYINAHKRLKVRDALFTALLIEYTLFQDEIKEQFKSVIEKTISYVYKFTGQEANIDIKIPAMRGIDYNAVIEPLGNSLNGLLTSDAEYRVRQLMASIGQAPDKTKYDLNDINNIKIIKRGISAMANNTSTGNQNGILIDYGMYMTAKARIEALIEADVEKVIFVAVLDNATTDICRSLNGLKFYVRDLIIGKNMPPIRPPIHPCRSGVRPISPSQ